MTWFRDVDRWLTTEVLPHQHSFLALARKVTGNGDAARDIIQDVYAEVLAGEGWRKARDGKAFVLRVVYCRSLNWVNRQRVVPIQSLPDFESVAFADSGPDAFERLSGREELAVVLDIIDELPDRCREVVTMRRFDELPPKEIARRLGISLITVERHLARGVALLTAKMAERGTLRRRRKGVVLPFVKSGQ